MRNLFYNNTQQKKLFFNNLPIQRAYLDNVFCFEAVIRVPYPVLISNPTWTGKAVSPTFNNINNDAFTITGNSYINAGSYKAVFKLKDGYGQDVNDESEMFLDYEIPWTVNRASIEKPTVTATVLTYNGSAFDVTSVLSGYNSAYMNLSGTTSAINAGTYTVTVTPDANHCWPDGTYDAISLTWTVNKKSFAKPYLSGPAKSWSFDGSNRSWSVINYNSSYMNQSGSTSFNASSYSGGTKTETVTWTLKDTNNYQWSDGTSSAVIDTWRVTWTNGQSHYANDIWNSGWSRGSITFSSRTARSGSWQSGNSLFMFSQDWGESGGSTATIKIYAPGLSRASHVYVRCRFSYDCGDSKWDTDRGIRTFELRYNASNGYACSMRPSEQQPYQSTSQMVNRKWNVSETFSSSGNTIVLSFYTSGPSNRGWYGDVTIERIWFD